MAITEPVPARILRGSDATVADAHPFRSVGDLPRIATARPQQTGNRALDAIRAAAWDEGYAAGLAKGSDDGFEVGFDRGAAAGREAGYRDGMQEAQEVAARQVMAAVGSALGALESSARALDARDAVVLTDVEAKVTDLALAVAEAVICRELALAAEPGRDAIRRALALAPDEAEYVARLNPADVESLGDISDLAPGRSLVVAADPSVLPGGCLVEAGAARLDARIETALARVRDVLAQP